MDWQMQSTRQSWTVETCGPLIHAVSCSWFYIVACLSYCVQSESIFAIFVKAAWDSIERKLFLLAVLRNARDKRQNLPQKNQDTAFYGDSKFY